MQVQKIDYRGWPNCICLRNDQVKMIASADFGPRILFFGSNEGENQFYEDPQQAGLVGGNQWRVVGGHRFWHAPEDPQRTYLPDNDPLTFEDHGDFIRLIQPAEAATGVQKELDICLAADSAKAVIVHRLRNLGLWEIELAAWGISVMHPGGTAILPLPEPKSHDEQLTPSNSLVLWGYTDFTDPRWTLGARSIRLRQDPTNPVLQKVGLKNTLGWIGYLRNETLFTVHTETIPGATYPDMGCTVELYTDSNGLEMETLGPLVRLKPAETVEHRETWTLTQQVSAPRDESDLVERIFPLANR